VRGPCLAAAIIVLVVCPIAASCGLEKPPSQVTFITVDTDPDWSPDGRLIAFASSRRLGGIYVIHPDGKGLRQLFHGVASNVDWSPDGRRIAFQGDHGIYVLPRNGGHPVLLLQGDFRLPAWAPDGRKLAVVKEERDLATAIYVVNLDGSELRRLLQPYPPRSPSHWGAVAASETWPAWSPDGRQMAFETGDGHVVTAYIPGRKRVTIATAGYEPAWSPDGRSIAFQQSDGSLWLANADGGGDERLLASNGRDPSWAPDSRTLVFEVRHTYGREWRRPQSLSVVDAAGGALRQLTYGNSVLDDPAWRGDRATP
jgi:Tol biopolymer transport system component